MKIKVLKKYLFIQPFYQEQDVTQGKFIFKRGIAISLDS